MALAVGRMMAVGRTQGRQQRNTRIGIRAEGISTEQPLEIQGVSIKGEPPTLGKFFTR
jgi:hypothetical protein